MIDAVKDYLTPKTYSILAYICLIVQFLSGLAFTAVVVALRTGEFGKFNCAVATESTAVKTHVEKTCYNQYEQTYNSTLPFYGFVLLSIWFPVIVAVIYSLAVRRRVEEIDSNYGTRIHEEAHNNTALDGSTFYVFYCYFFHLVVRLIFGIIIASVQYPVFFPNGFDFEFVCSLPTNSLNGRQVKSTSATCHNSAAWEKNRCGVIVFVFNAGLAIIVLMEVIRLFRRFPSCKVLVGWSCDAEFVAVYFLRKRYNRVNNVHLTTVECITFYKQQVLNTCRPCDIQYGIRSGLDDLFVDLVIHTERAPHKFPKNMDRHEIYHVYMKVPEHSILLEKIVDLFYPNKDTKGNIPIRILVIGRPGIGKTVLTEKIMHDWANEVDEFYYGKIALYFKLRWFNPDQLKNMTLKTFLRSGTQLSEEKFESLYEVIKNQPDKSIRIFDGLDEFHGDFLKCLRQQLPPDDPNTCMSAVSLFLKLISGQLLHGATVLVTSRPTASDFYSRLQFDRNVEIIGFTSDKIKKYVDKFCDNHNRSDLKPKIWNHIKSSSDLLNISYIPVNCFIVSVMLFDCLSDSINQTGALPTTITELYQAAIDHFHKYHDKMVHVQSSKEAIKKLQLLAYKGIERGKLVFNEGLFDEEMKKSGLLNSLSNPLFPVQTQFCFIHLTIQEFLAAKHVTEMQAPEEVKQFIFSHIESGKWQLVLLFIAGLLGKKLKMLSDENHRYQDCVWAFTSKGFVVDNGELDLSYPSVFSLKCLREVGDEGVAREACETTSLKDVVSLRITSPAIFRGLSSSDVAAVSFVCKYVKKLKELHLSCLSVNEEYFREVCKLLQQRCIEQLFLQGLFGVLPEYVFTSLVKSKCTLNHPHFRLTNLVFQYCRITDECLSTLCTFLNNGHGRWLELLSLDGCEITSRGLSVFCEMFDNKLCPELASLNLRWNEILDEGVRDLCNAFVSHVKLTKLLLDYCLLTDQCIPSLCKLLNGSRCELTFLSLGGNHGIGDQGVRMFCELVLAKEHCKLTQLYLSYCSVTDKCMPLLCELLNDERCKLTVLSLSDNEGIGDESVRLLWENVLTGKHCKLVELDLAGCSLTDKCLPELSKAILDEYFLLNKLVLQRNNFANEGKKLLRELETHKHCKSRGLKIEL